METLTNILPEFFLFGSILLFWGASILFFILLAIAEKAESWGWSLILFGGFTYLLISHSSVDIYSVFNLTNVLWYIGLGFVYSLIKTYIYGRKTKGKEYALKGKVFFWWFLFPVSIVNWIFSDLIKDVYDFIYSKLEGIYKSLYMAGQPKESPKDATD